MSPPSPGSPRARDHSSCTTWVCSGPSFPPQPWREVGELAAPRAEVQTYPQLCHPTLQDGSLWGTLRRWHSPGPMAFPRRTPSWGPRSVTGAYKHPVADRRKARRVKGASAARGTWGVSGTQRLAYRICFNPRLSPTAPGCWAGPLFCSVCFHVWWDSLSPSPVLSSSFLGIFLFTAH